LFCLGNKREIEIKNGERRRKKNEYEAIIRKLFIFYLITKASFFNNWTQLENFFSNFYRKNKNMSLFLVKPCFIRFFFLSLSLHTNFCIKKSQAFFFAFLTEYFSVCGLQWKFFLTLNYNDTNLNSFLDKN